MKTLLKENDNKNKWYPNPILLYKNTLNIGHTKKLNVIKSNIAYSLQYLEYIQKQLNELNVSNVLTSMLYKSYVITGMGIVEVLFTILLKILIIGRKTSGN